MEVVLQPEIIKRILKFWFGENYSSWPEKEFSKNWFMGGPSFDEAIRKEFGGLIEQMLHEDLKLVEDAEKILASIILLDQFTRNIYRGTVQAFSGDSKALKLALHAVETKSYLVLPAHQRIFLAMPFEHSENLQHQQLCLELFNEMIEQNNEPIKSKLVGFKSHAIEHYEIVKQFTRFPHRNEILGRESTVKELKYITTGKSFGQ